MRRSVANHLNDIGKDHPALLAGWLADHLPDAPAPRRQLLRHASRTLIKAGDPRVLSAWAWASASAERSLAITPNSVLVGGDISLQVTLQSTRARPRPWWWTMRCSMRVHAANVHPRCSRAGTSNSRQARHARWSSGTACDPSRRAATTGLAPGQPAGQRPQRGRGRLRAQAGRLTYQFDSRSGVAPMRWIDRSAPSNSSSADRRKPVRPLIAP